MVMSYGVVAGPPTLTSCACPPNSSSEVCLSAPRRCASHRVLQPWPALCVLQWSLSFSPSFFFSPRSSSPPSLVSFCPGLITALHCMLHIVFYVSTPHCPQLWGQCPPPWGGQGRFAHRASRHPAPPRCGTASLVVTAWSHSLALLLLSPLLFPPPAPAMHRHSRH